MLFELETNLGYVNIARDVISNAAGGAATTCFGVVGMASRHQVRDGFNDILGKENYSKGIVVREFSGEIHIDMYIVVQYGTKISTIAENVQKKVKYTLRQVMGIEVDAVNIFVKRIVVDNI